MSQRCYGLRGRRPYFKPAGWLRYAVRRSDFELYKDWCVAYHGTMSKTIMSILLKGLRPPGEEGVKISYGQAYSTTNKTIYLSPSERNPSLHRTLHVKNLPMRTLLVQLRWPHEGSQDLLQSD